MSTTDKPQTVAAPKKATPTEYVLLERVGTSWSIVDKVSTTGANAAIKKYLAEKGKVASARDAIVAVPARSWQPVKPKTTTKTITTLEAL